MATVALLATLFGAAMHSAPQGEGATYVGQETCLESGCHEGAYVDGSSYAGSETFRESFHQQSHRRPDAKSVRIERYFAGDSIITAPVMFAGLTDTLFIELSKEESSLRYFVRMRLSGGEETSLMELSYTIGGNSRIQRYMVMNAGSHYVLPFQYVLPHYNDRSDTGTTFAIVEPGKWLVADSTRNPPGLRFLRTSTNEFRKQSWDRTCAPCHATVSSMDILTSGTDSSWRSTAVHSGGDLQISVDCESCHGPGSEHSAFPTSSNIVSPGRYAGTRQGTELKLALCNQCHTRVKSTDGHYDFPFDEANRRLYIPGAPLDGYIFNGDHQHGADIWPDSSERGHHQHGQDLMRAYGTQKHIYKDGCWTCHTVHGNGDGLPFQLNRNWYSLKNGEGCVSCHGTMGALFNPPLEDLTRTDVVNWRRINLHTKHSPQISQCVNCHFSKTASISFTDLPTKPYYEFTSHHMKVIRPNLTREYRDDGNGIGQINTCAESCHRNGRGSRNFRGSDPLAPDFGIHDGRLTTWNEETDIALADSLWWHYQRMFLPLLSADRVAGPQSPRTLISSIQPNPLREGSTIRFSLAHAADISLEVFSPEGRRVKLLATGRHEAGEYHVQWDGMDNLGRMVASGSYLVRLSTEGGITTGQLQVLR